MEVRTSKSAMPGTSRNKRKGLHIPFTKHTYSVQYSRFPTCSTRLKHRTLQFAKQLQYTRNILTYIPRVQNVGVYLPVTTCLLQHVYLRLVVLYRASMDRRPRSPRCYKMHCSMVPIVLQHCSMENSCIVSQTYQFSTWDSVLSLFPLGLQAFQVYTRVSSHVFWCANLRLAFRFGDYRTGLYYTRSAICSQFPRFGAPPRVRAVRSGRIFLQNHFAWTYSFGNAMFLARVRMRESTLLTAPFQLPHPLL